MVREIERAGAQPCHAAARFEEPAGDARQRRRGSRRVIARTDIDIVHARSRAPAWSALAAARRTGRAFRHHVPQRLWRGSWLKRRYNCGDGAGRARHRHLATSSRATSPRPMASPPERLRVVPRGVDRRALRSRAHQRRAHHPASRTNGACPTACRSCMLPGRLTRWKGHARADRGAARASSAARSTASSSAAARSATGASSMAAIAADPPPCRSAVLDECRDMPAAYMLADVVVSASTEPEGFGRVIVEAQAMGRPVIATAHGGARRDGDARRDRLAGAAGRSRRARRGARRGARAGARGAPGAGRARDRPYPRRLQHRAT